MPYEPDPPATETPPPLTFDDVGAQRVEHPDAPPRPDVDAPGEPPRSEPPSLLRRAGGAIAAAAILVVKFAAKLKALVLLLPKLKLFTTAASMLVSIAAYALYWDWQFAVGLVLLLLVHELGHVIQIRREGIPVSAPVFIPFLGAAVAIKQSAIKDAAMEARIGLAGPILGSLGCLVPLAIHFATGSDFFQALAFVGFFLNLFNLLPFLPLDGGRAMSALSPKVWLVGFGLLVAVTIAYPTPITVLILALGGFETYRRWKLRRSPETQAYYRVRPAARVAIAVVYIGLAAALGVGMHFTHLERTL